MFHVHTHVNDGNVNGGTLYLFGIAFNTLHGTSLNPYSNPMKWILQLLLLLYRMRIQKFRVVVICSSLYNGGVEEAG